MAAYLRTNSQNADKASRDRAAYLYLSSFCVCALTCADSPARARAPLRSVDVEAARAAAVPLGPSLHRPAAAEAAADAVLFEAQ